MLVLWKLVKMPHYFLPGNVEGLNLWLQVVVENDGVICVSESTMKDLATWIKDNDCTTPNRFTTTWSHNGVDLSKFSISKGLPPDSESVLKELAVKFSFLMVGTLEPRKGHLQVLEAFKILWQDGHPLNLVFVGKQGWMVEELVGQLRSHPEFNRRLFWLEGISDEYLEQVYGACTCLIAASYGEGFGLPLIEAAQHKLPIIARDIPVFREVAGENAFFFQTKNPRELSHNIQEWIQIFETGQHPRSEQIPWITWEQSAEHLLSKLMLK